MSQPTPIPALEMRNISKTFGAVKALRGVSFTVYPGEVHALMGENGAGKSTLMKVLSGAYVADRGGSVLVGGEPMPTGDPKLARERGIAVIYQELSLAPNLSVAENMFLGREPSRSGLVNRARCNALARPVLDRLGVEFAPGTPVQALSLGERQMVEIARALAQDARIIVMDEPTTSLTGRETDKLFSVIEALTAQGIAIVYISHRMEEIYRLSDRCSVLRDGGYVGTLERSELNAKQLVGMMVGRDLSAFYKKDHASAGAGDRPERLRVAEMADGRRVHGVSFAVRAGEVLGIAGLVGSGRTELARLIYGADPATAGTVWLDGREVTPKSPRAALDEGIVYLTEDRKALGLFLDMSIQDNIAMAVLERDAGRGGLLNFRTAAQRARGAIGRLSIKTPSARLNVGALSGGNQQKVLLARLLEANPRVVILDEPTRGVDVGAKSEIYRLIDGLAREGLAVVMISSELPEIIGVADRVLVMRDGRIAGELHAAPDRPIRQEEIMTLATGAAPSGGIDPGTEPGTGPESEPGTAPRTNPGLDPQTTPQKKEGTAR